MTCCPPDGEETFLMPLKKRKHLPCPGDGQSQREKRCETEKCGAPKPRSRSACAKEVDEQVTCPEPCFEDSVEWQSTKCVAAGLFRALGQHYDELWFPTVVNEWSALYYQCNHAADYWCARDEWLCGDEEVRLAVWSEVLRHREQHERQLDQLNRNVLCDTGKCNPNADLMDVHDGCNAEVKEYHGCPNMANDRFDLPYKNIEQFCEKDLPSDDERARAEAEVAEIALADPDDDPDWVQMRRKMRGSFAALNMAQCEVSAELLDHIMIELCKYWANAPVSENSCPIDPQLECNIMREIQNFRFKLFGVAVEIEPELQQSGPDECQEPEPCRKPKPFRKQELRREPEICRTPEPCRRPEPRQEPDKFSPKEPDPCCPKKPDSYSPKKPESYSPKKLDLCCPQEQDPCCPKKPDLCCPKKLDSFSPKKPDPCCPKKNDPSCPPEDDPCCPNKPDLCCPQEPDPCCPKKPDLCCPQEPDPCCPQEPESCCPPEPEPCQKPEQCCPRKPELLCPLGPEAYCSQDPVPCCPPPKPKPRCCAPRRSSKTKMAEARARHNATQVRDRDITTGWLGGRPNP